MTAYASFEDFLYIILGIVWIAFSFYKAKKKKQSQKEGPTTSKKKSILESLFDEIGIKEDDTETIYQEPSQDLFEHEIENKPVLVDEPNEVFSYDDFYEESNYIPTNTVKEKKRSTETNVTTDLNYKINKLNVLKKNMKINLRKAVIYSEILKKPDF